MNAGMVLMSGAMLGILALLLQAWVWQVSLTVFVLSFLYRRLKISY
jgi:hypothetical protein